MGKITGFLEIDKDDRDYAPIAERLKTYSEFCAGRWATRPPRPGGALHGLRRALLPPWLPGQQTRSRLETNSSTVTTGSGRCAICTRPTTSPSSPAASAGALRGGVHAQHPRRAGVDQDDRMRHRRQGLGAGLDRAGDQPGQDRQVRCGDRLGSSGSPARSSSPAPGTMCISTKRTTRPAG